eukprot:3284339-Rhodomonas_salina.2
MGEREGGLDAEAAASSRDLPRPLQHLQLCLSHPLLPPPARVLRVSVLSESVSGMEGREASLHPAPPSHCPCLLPVTPRLSVHLTASEREKRG